MKKPNPEEALIDWPFELQGRRTLPERPAAGLPVDSYRY